MDKNPRHRSSPKNRHDFTVPTWFKVSLSILVALIVLKVTGLQVVVNVSYDGIPILASLTDMKIYLVMLGILLVYILISGLWSKFFGPKDL